MVRASSMHEVGGEYKFLTEKPKGKRLIGKTRCGLSTKMYPNEMDGAQDRDLQGSLVNMITNIRVPYITCWAFHEWLCDCWPLNKDSAPWNQLRGVKNDCEYPIVVKTLAAGRKVASSRPVEVNEFFSIYLILPEALSPAVYTASNRHEYQKQG
jgi:hypothetical protein